LLEDFFSDYIPLKLEQALKLHQQGDISAAQKIYQEIVSLNADDFDGLHLLGFTYYQQGNLERAIDLITQAISNNQNYAPAHFNLGCALQDSNYWIKALESYDRAIEMDPNYIDAFFKRSETCIKLNRFTDALINFDKLVALDPNNYLIFYQRAAVFIKINQTNDALIDYQKSIELKPNFIEGYISLANIFFELKKYDQAFYQYQKAVEIAPDYDLLYGLYLQSKIRMCHWQGLAEDLTYLERNIQNGKNATLPFIALSLFDKPDLHQLAAKTYANSKSFNQKIHEPFLVRGLKKKIRIGYYSSDYRIHPLSQLMIEIIRLHDRNQFEVYGFSLSPKRSDEMTTQISATFDKFIDIASFNTNQIVELSRRLEIDIAVDLNGHTEYARTQIFSARCAPIQIQYLGYPGTLSVDSIDYIMADSTLIHPGNRAFFSEKVLGLPGCYITTNSQQEIAEQTHFTRGDFLLPNDGFVFCCFNNNYKIMPDIFDSWMRILQSVDGSVLWLLGDNPFSIQNLCSEAQLRGVDPNRLIFAKRVNLKNHLARHCFADLFLDTLPYNAHTTAIDSLWSGLPVLTLIGQSFSSRVAASLLKAIDLPELICHTQAEYEAKAIELALNPEKLADLKKKLANNKDKTPLFNGAQITRDIESAYLIAYKRYQEGFTPEDVFVGA